MAKHFLEEFAARKDIGREAMRVFLYLNARCNFCSPVQVPHVEIAERLGMHKQNVNRALCKLEALAVIIPGPEASTWRLNPHAGG